MASANAKLCTYKYRIWNVKEKRSIREVNIQKPYVDLLPTEIGPLGCTPCQEDQTEILLIDKNKLTICKKIATKIQNAINTAIIKGLKITSLKGYHPQMSRGKIMPNGDRTELSNHSFGVALDVNPEHNGLYDQCVEWGPQCRLLMGGRYNPNSKDAIKSSDHIVMELKLIGLEWGGKIAGKQKDFMHFSPTGY